MNLILKDDFLRFILFFFNKSSNFPVVGGKFKWRFSQAVGKNRSLKGKQLSDINNKTNTATN